MIKNWCIYISRAYCGL